MTRPQRRVSKEQSLTETEHGNFTLQPSVINAAVLRVNSLLTTVQSREMYSRAEKCTANTYFFRNIKV